MKRLRLAADKRKVILAHAKERGRFTAGPLLAVKAVTDGDEGWRQGVHNKWAKPLDLPQFENMPS